jgi:hypothetical protein
LVSYHPYMEAWAAPHWLIACFLFLLSSPSFSPLKDLQHSQELWYYCNLFTSGSPMKIIPFLYWPFYFSFFASITVRRQTSPCFEGREPYLLASWLNGHTWRAFCLTPSF